MAFTMKTVTIIFLVNFLVMQGVVCAPSVWSEANNFDNISGTKLHPLKLLKLKQESDLLADGDYLKTNIIGGKKSTISKHPYMAALSHYNSFVGSAIILNKQFLVTAAWNIYWDKPETYVVRVGSSYAYKGGKTYNVKSYYIHPQYDQQWVYDIALIKLSNPIKFSKTVKSISLASKLPKNGSNSVVSGWGEDKYSTAGTQILKEATVPYIDYETCKTHYSDVAEFTNYSICSFKNGVGPCANDFGSPLVYNNKLIGVYSGAYECGSIRRPPVYADVTKYRKWIEGTIKKNTNINENETGVVFNGNDNEDIIVEELDFVAELVFREFQ